MIDEDKKAELPTTLNVSCFEHKGEVIVVFSQPLTQWFMPPEAARRFGKAFTDLADKIESVALGGATVQ